MISPDDLRAVRGQLQAELVEAEAEYVRIQRQVNALRQTISGISGLLNGDSPAALLPDVSVSPRGAASVLQVLRERPGIGWTVRQLTEELRRRGWAPSSRDPAGQVDAVRTSALRAWRTPGSGIIRDGSAYIYQDVSSESLPPVGEKSVGEES